jgi:hypothetical protein
MPGRWSRVDAKKMKPKDGLNVMAESPAVDQTSDVYRAVATILLTFAVGLLVAGVVLLSNCAVQTTTVGFSTSDSCVYPFQQDGLVVLYFAAILTILSVNMFTRTLRSFGPGSLLRLQTSALSGLAAAGATLLFLLTLSSGA